MGEKTMKILLEDLRFPIKDLFDYRVVCFLDFQETIDNIWHNFEQVTYVSFGYDSGEGSTGYDCCKFLINFDMKHNILSKAFEFDVHSTGIVERVKIEPLMYSWLNLKKQLEG